MIFEAPWKTLRTPSVLIPIEDLIGDASGGRLPEVVPESLSPALAAAAVAACPTGAFELREAGRDRLLELDYGRCVGCGWCQQAAPDAIRVAHHFSASGRRRDHLKRRWSLLNRQEVLPDSATATAAGDPAPIARSLRKWIGRALNVRALDAGSCNGCEAELHALSNPWYDLSRFGIEFVASPRHADLLLVTGTVTRNLHEAVRQTWLALPEPKRVLAVGACACSGGVFAASPAVVGPVDRVIPVDGFVPGCPPTPAMLLTGILHLMRRG